MNVLEGADGTLTVTKVTWWPALARRGLVRTSGGELAFESINGISLERKFNTVSGRRSNARRIDLHTTSGLVPLTSGYSGGVASQRAVAERIRTMLKLEGSVVE